MSRWAQYGGGGQSGGVALPFTQFSLGELIVLVLIVAVDAALLCSALLCSALLCSAVLCPSAPACCPSVPDRSLSRHDKISPPPPDTDAPHTSHLTPLTSHLPPPTNAHPVLAIHVPCPSTISVLSCPDLLVLVLQLVLVLETGNSIVLPSRAPVFHPPPSPVRSPSAVSSLSLTSLYLASAFSSHE